MHAGAGCRKVSESFAAACVPSMFPTRPDKGPDTFIFYTCPL